MQSIHTERLTLRDPVLSDSKALQHYQKDERYLEFYASKPDALAIIKQAVAWSSERPRRNFQFVVENSEQRVIGCAGLRTKDYAQGEAEIGIEIDPGYWKHGYAREVLNALIEFAKHQEFNRLYASTHRGNFRALNLMRSAFFTEEHVVGDDVVLLRCLESVV